MQLQLAHLFKMIKTLPFGRPSLRSGLHFRISRPTALSSSQARTQSLWAVMECPQLGLRAIAFPSSPLSPPFPSFAPLRPCVFALNCVFFLLIFLSSLNASPPPFLFLSSWSQKTLQNMSIDEKIGQLFMVAAYLDREFANREIGNPHIIEEIDTYITRYHVGGLAYVGPSEFAKQVTLTNHYQEISKYPILIAQDLEWGLSMRIKDGMAFPKNITLGAVNDTTLIYEVGKEIGRQAKLIGVHMNLSPVLDVNIEPENISINVRSFGCCPKLVAKNGVAMIHGLQDVGIIASAKHFPGLGDIKVDPHFGLPYNNHNKIRLNEVEFYPFVQAIKAEVCSIQTEHLVISAYSDLPASLSYEVVSDLLKNQLGFKGLILSGALRMQALTKHFSEEDIIIKSFVAGHDMLLMPQNFPKAHRILKEALSKGIITEQQIDERVLKILQMKEKLGLHLVKNIPMPTKEQLHTNSANLLNKKLYKKAVKIERDEQHLIPGLSQKKPSVAYIEMGRSTSHLYLETLKTRFDLDVVAKLPLEYNNEKEFSQLLERLDRYSLIIIAFYPADPRQIEQIRLLNDDKQKEQMSTFRVHGIPTSAIALIDALHCYNNKSMITFFGNPFGLPFFKDYSTVIMAYDQSPEAEEAAAALLFEFEERGNR